LTGRLSCGHSETSQTNRRQSSLAGLALNWHFENSATPQPFRPLRSSKCPFSAVENLPPITVCCNNLLSEKDVFQGNEKAGSGKPDGRDPPGTPQAAAREQRRTSLVGDGAKWRITNFKQVARAMSKWA
jgi:hypothetical protein